MKLINSIIPISIEEDWTMYYKAARIERVRFVLHSMNILFCQFNNLNKFLFFYKKLYLIYFIL